MKGSLNKMNNTLGDMKFSIDYLFLLNAMKENLYQVDYKIQYDNLIATRCKQILLELKKNDKKNKDKNMINIQNENKPK